MRPVNYSYLFLIIGLALKPSLGFGQLRALPQSVNPSLRQGTLSAAPASGLVSRSGQNIVTFKINNSCFGTNLRNVANPLAPNSTIQASIVIGIGGKDYTLYAEYPAGLVTRWGVYANNAQVEPNSTVTSNPAGTTGAMYGNSMIFKTPFPINASIDNQGNVTDTSKGDVVLKGYSFNQVVNSCDSLTAIYGSAGYSSYTPSFACGDYMGKNGPLTATVQSFNISSDQSNLELNVSFPGEAGFCGGYWSPLMVFFDDERPSFQNVSDFPLHPGAKTFWPEPKHPGYFLVLDRNQNGLIDASNELFGDNGGKLNGFEALKEFDSNHDGLINSKDKDFKKLVLWNDQNGNGKSESDELIPAEKKLISISLRYQNKETRTYGAYAEARESSFFVYKDAKNNRKRGRIIDIWLKPANPALASK